MKAKKGIVLFGIVCIVGVLATGCSPSLTSATKTAADNKEKEASPEKSDDTEKVENAADMEEPQESAEGKWHVLEPEAAAAFDADFLGTVWHIAEGAFSIAETKAEILEDGSLTSSTPSSKANIPDSQLIHVVVDEDTYFYIRTISGNGESYEDTEAGFGDLKEHMSVEMRGSFENDVFYATEIRMIKIS